MATIKEVADLAGVAVGTVSHVINGSVPVDDLFYPSITTVVQPAYDIGWRATEILLDRIENTLAEGESKTVRLHASLKIGDSSRRS